MLSSIFHYFTSPIATFISSPSSPLPSTTTTTTSSSTTTTTTTSTTSTPSLSTSSSTSWRFLPTLPPPSHRSFASIPSSSSSSSSTTQTTPTTKTTKPSLDFVFASSSSPSWSTSSPPSPMPSLPSHSTTYLPTPPPSSSSSSSSSTSPLPPLHSLPLRKKKKMKSDPPVSFTKKKATSKGSLASASSSSSSSSSFSSFHGPSSSFSFPSSSWTSVTRVLGHVCILMMVLGTSLGVLMVLVPMVIMVGLITVAWSPVLLLNMYVTALVVQALYASRIRFHPVRIMKMYKAVTENILGNLFSPLAHHLLRFSIYRMVFGKRLRPYVARNLVYSETTASRLDLYLPASAHLASKRVNGETIMSPGHLPVLIFIYGGAWNSGSKEIYQPLGHQLRRSGILTVIPEYRTYPTGTTDTMIQEVADCITWVHQNISHYGGDPTNIHVCGHSSGAHLTLLTLLASAWSSSSSLFSPHHVLRWSSTFSLHTLPNEDVRTSSMSYIPTTFPKLPQSLPPLQSVMLFSGVYDLVQHYQYECERGIEEISGLRRANGHTYENLLLRSPTLLLSSFLKHDRTHTLDFLLPHLPYQLVLFHGHHDHTVPMTQTTDLFQFLKQCGVENLDVWFHPLDHAQPLAHLMNDSKVFQQVVRTIRKVSRNNPS